MGKIIASLKVEEHTCIVSTLGGTNLLPSGVGASVLMSFWAQKLDRSTEKS